MKNQIIASIKQCNSEKELFELWKSSVPKWTDLLSAEELRESIRAKDEKKFRLQHLAKKKLPIGAKSGPVDRHFQINECRACHQLKFWRIRGSKVWICSLCHPPVKVDGIEWLDLSRCYYDRI
ncbi:hypothetical protein [uncultured Desulfosarcina sp.]|uniref:hypothetical protein n=1 Tax=uncultured Desulfosarcina sp. TaxID=218289 RepID=UPI0029C64B0E|nr:hypothetical protein [uncultured Desulfosarcina sp.]